MVLTENNEKQLQEVDDLRIRMLSQLKSLKKTVQADINATQIEFRRKNDDFQTSITVDVSEHEFLTLANPSALPSA